MSFFGLFRPAIEAAARQQFIDETLAEARAAYRESQQRLSYRGEPSIPAVAMEDLALPEAVELEPVEGARSKGRCPRRGRSNAMAPISIADLLNSVCEPRALSPLGFGPIQWDTLPINGDHVTFLHIAASHGLGFEEARHGHS